MGEYTSLAVLFILLFVAFFVIKTVVKTAIRLVVLAGVAVLLYLYFSGTLPVSI